MLFVNSVILYSFFNLAIFLLYILFDIPYIFNIYQLYIFCQYYIK
nr:MAG: hypothetical protein [Microvirus sp.]